MYIPLFHTSIYLLSKTTQNENIIFVSACFCFLFVCLGFIVPRANFSLFLRRHHFQWRAANFDLYSTLMAIEQCGFFNVPHLLWHEPTLYNGHLRWPVTFTLVAESFGTEAVHSCFKDISVLGIELWSPACEANALIYATAAVFVQIYMWQG